MLIFVVSISSILVIIFNTGYNYLIQGWFAINKIDMSYL